MLTLFSLEVLLLYVAAEVVPPVLADR
jgi:hypothetical protein